jgi:hypothetical protein
MNLSLPCATLFLNNYEQRPSSFNRILPTTMLFITQMVESSHLEDTEGLGMEMKES